MPIGIIGSLIICTILYVAFSVVMTGLANYKEFKGMAAPVAVAQHFLRIDHDIGAWPRTRAGEADSLPQATLHAVPLNGAPVAVGDSCGAPNTLGTRSIAT